VPRCARIASITSPKYSLSSSMTRCDPAASTTRPDATADWARRHCGSRAPPYGRGGLGSGGVTSGPFATLDACVDPGPRAAPRVLANSMPAAKPTAMVDAIEAQIAPLERELRRLARRQTGCRALMRLYGMGELTSLVTLCELGDVQRLSASRKAVRLAGIDIGVHRSDRRARAGKLTRQGSPQLRWALYEAALSACRPSSPDHADYLALKARGLSHTRASLTIARKLARRSYHVLHQLGPAALGPIPTADARPPGAFVPNVRHSSMRTTLPTSSRSCCGSHPRVAAHQRPSGRSHSTRTDPSTIPSPTPTGSRTQIRPGSHRARRHIAEHNHSPPPLD
jgi:hypothetical protein